MKQITLALLATTLLVSPVLAADVTKTQKAKSAPSAHIRGE